MKKYLMIAGVVVATISLNFKMIETGAVLSWVKMSHDFGTIEKNIPVTANFSFQNTGEETMVILNAKGSCGCTVADYTRDTIEPGAFGEVTATYNAAKVGMFSKTVTVTASVGDEPIVLFIKGEVIE